jgi:aerobic-type carbon monoxide dehydrogenase small subunit (CoxS/CutS family)
MSDRETEPAQAGLSRRGFLKGVGAGAAAVSLVQVVAETQVVEAQSLDSGVGPGTVTVTLDINGEQTQLDVEPRVTLLDALRNRLDLTGTKKVCDRGTCGACTVLLDGALAYSCSMLAVEAVGTKITTIEGLGAAGEHPLQIAWAEHNVPQCGYCQSGQIMQAASLLAENPNPDDQQIEDAMDSMICRCGTYQRIRAAIKSAAGGAA